jgi:hypothetical protein
VFLFKRSNRSLHHSSNLFKVLVSDLPPLLILKLAAGERIERPLRVPKARVLPLNDPASSFQRDGFMHRTHNTADSSILWPSFLRSVRPRSTKSR